MGIEQRAESLAGAMEACLDYGNAGANDRGRLFRAYSFDVAEQQDDTVIFGKLADAPLHQLARFAILHDGIRRRLPGDRRIALVFAVAEVGQEIFDGPFGVALQSSEAAQCGVDDDAMQPGAEPRLPLELADALEGGQESVLYGVVGVLFISQDTPGDEQHLAAVGSNARFEGVSIAGLHPRQQSRFVGVHPGLDR
jgi:hypothetical protein